MADKERQLENTADDYVCTLSDAALLLAYRGLASIWDRCDAVDHDPMQTEVRVSSVERGYIKVENEILRRMRGVSDA